MAVAQNAFSADRISDVFIVASYCEDISNDDATGAGRMTIGSGTKEELVHD